MISHDHVDYYVGFSVKRALISFEVPRLCKKEYLTILL
jgi:hypothetical protein